MSDRIQVRSARDLELASNAARMAAEVLAMITPWVKPGITTEELDRICHDYIVGTQGAIPANLGYHGYTKTTCISINHVVCHGIPSDKTPIKDGDIINIDVALVKDGWHGDTSRMYLAGKVSREARRLVKAAYEAMWAGIEMVRPGATLGDVGHAIEQTARQYGYSSVKDYCGHGIGRIYHDEPQVLHYGNAGVGLKLKPGMLFTIEPMINAGKHLTRTLSDNWTVVTRDRSLSAQWEHMVLVTETGHEVLTAWPDDPAEYHALAAE